MSRWIYAGPDVRGNQFYCQRGPAYEPGEFRVTLMAEVDTAGAVTLTRPVACFDLPHLAEALRTNDFEAVYDYDDDDIGFPSLADLVEDLGSLLALTRGGGSSGYVCARSGVRLRRRGAGEDSAGCGQ